MTRRVCAVITARPSYSRIKTALLSMRDRPDIDLKVVIAGSALLDRYGSVVEQVEADGIPINAQVFMVLEGENTTSMAKTTGLGIIELATTFHGLAPDLVVSVADRYETLATATAAAYMNIPLAHIQGGEVSGSIDEKVRHAVTKLADLHLTATELARERVVRMGEAPGRVHCCGCPSIDLAAEVARSPELDFDPFDRYGGVGESFDLSDGYLIVMQHPVTTEYAASRQHIEETLFAVSGLGLPTLWFWPNVDAGSDGTSKGIRAFRENQDSSLMHFFKNMSPTDFLRVLVNSRAIVGNSSVAIREASYLGVPAVNIGSRQAGRERGHNVVDTDHSRKAIVEAIEKQASAGRLETDHLYGDGSAGSRIAELLATSELSIEKRLTY